jgi:hypothetical protein
LPSAPMGPVDAAAEGVEEALTVEGTGAIFMNVLCVRE